ncbi:MAG: BMC domain-containing protein [Acutalibacteraceae bacterium]|nr:BMC domain-containing protein [Acutalibacteraceae bacterium]
MKKALAMVEYKTVSSGMQAADIMVKTADVEVIEATTVCPGKYMVLISGELSAVRAAVEAAAAKLPDSLIDKFVLGNPHESIFTALYGTTDIGNPDALGVIETFSSCSAIVAADVAAKTSLVDLIELRLSRGMCGKSYVLLTGGIAAVEAAVDRAKKSVGEDGMFLDSAVIPHPDEKIWHSIL